MTSSVFKLSEFKKDIKLGEVCVPVKAFSMDDEGGKKHWGNYADLGTINCCDYLHISKNNKVSLIEHKRLEEIISEEEKPIKYIANILKDQIILGGLSGSKRNKFQNTAEEIERKYLDYCEKNLINHLKLKLYGSLLILCVLKRKDQELEQQIKKEVSTFYFFSDSSETKILDRIQKRLNSFSFLKVKVFGKINNEKELKEILGVSD